MVNADLEIRELRPHNLDLAVAMAEGVREPVNPRDVVHAQSLVMYRGETLVAAALFEQRDDKRRLVICAAKDVESADEDHAEAGEDDTSAATQAAGTGEGGEAGTTTRKAGDGVTRHDIAVLIDKALMKLYSRGVRRFGIDLAACGSEEALQDADFLRGIARDQAA